MGILRLELELERVVNRNFDLKVQAIALRAVLDIDPKAVQKVVATNALLQKAHESLMDRAPEKKDHIKVAPPVANSAAQARAQVPLESLMDALLKAARKEDLHAHVQAKAVEDTNLAHRADVQAKAAVDMNLAHHADPRQKADMLSAKNVKALLKKDRKAAPKRSALIAPLVQPVKRAVARVPQVMVAPVKVAMEIVLRVSAAIMKAAQALTIQISFS